MDESRVMMKYIMPLAEIVTDFHDELKSKSSGYARSDNLIFKFDHRSLNN